jgi:hypothetical protein
LGAEIIPSQEVPATVAGEVAHTEELCMDFLRGVMFLALDVSRVPKFADSHFLAYVADDYLESAVGIPLMAREGIHNACYRTDSPGYLRWGERAAGQCRFAAGFLSIAQARH